MTVIGLDVCIAPVLTCSHDTSTLSCNQLVCQCQLHLTTVY